MSKVKVDDNHEKSILSEKEEKLLVFSWIYLFDVFSFDTLFKPKLKRKISIWGIKYKNIYSGSVRPFKSVRRSRQGQGISLRVSVF